MREKQVLVYRMAGSQGSSVARLLLERTRSLRDAGVEVFEGDRGNAKSLRAAFERKEVGV